MNEYFAREVEKGAGMIMSGEGYSVKSNESVLTELSVYKSFFILYRLVLVKISQGLFYQLTRVV